MPLVLHTRRLRSFRGCHPDPFLLFFAPLPWPLSPLPRLLSPLSVVSGQINAKAVLHVPEVKGGARVPGSHLITYLELFLQPGKCNPILPHYELWFQRNRHALCITAAGESRRATTSTEIITRRRNFSVATATHKRSTVLDVKSCLVYLPVESRVY